MTHHRHPLAIGSTGRAGAASGAAAEAEAAGIGAGRGPAEVSAGPAGHRRGGGCCSPVGPFVLCLPPSRLHGGSLLLYVNRVYPGMPSSC